MKKILLLLVLFSVGSIVRGNPVSLEKARQIALKYIKGNSARSPHMHAQSSNAVKSVQLSTDAYYVFNVGRNDGFIIVAADDKAPAVLGHSYNGTFDEKNIPDGMKWWLECCQRYVKYVATHKQPTMLAKPAKLQDLSGLMTTKWNQTSPYNLRCPKFDEGYAATGCVATAAAQILKYHEWPQNETSLIPGYESKMQKYEQTLQDLQPKKFNWGAMKDSYKFQEDADEVAWLMRYVGQAVKMQYSPKESGANVLLASFKEYFNYAATAQEIERSLYTEAEWQQRIYDEIKEKRPVLYTGGKFDVVSGVIGYHAFVCHGYKDGKFLINWGWGGLSDGEYDLSVLNPTLQGTGSFSGGSGYTIKQAVIVGLKPNKTGQQPENATNTIFVQDIKDVQDKYQRADNSADFVIDRIGLKVLANNYTKQKITFGWQLRDAENKPVEGTAILGQVDILNMMPNNRTYECVSNSLTFGKNLSAGIYYLVPMYAAESDGGNTWKPCVNSSMYIKLDVKDKEMLATAFSNRSDVECKTLTHEGQAEENIETKITATLVNKGISNTVTVYLYDTTTGKNANAVGFMIDAKAEQTVTIPYTPKTAGKHRVELYADNVRKVKIGELEIDVKEGLDAELTQSGYKIKNAQGNVVMDKFECDVTVENWGNDSYKNKIIAILSDRSSANVEVLTQDVDIAADGAQKLTFTFSKMEDGGEYCVKIYYMKKNLQTRLSLAAPPYYTFRLSNGIENVESGNVENGIVTIYRIDGSVATRVQQNVVKQTLKEMPHGVYIINGKKYLSY